jgi:ABC-2 type transport system permease protein
MLKLIQNENMKIYSRIGTWIMIFLLIAGISAMVVMVKYQPGFQDPNEENYKANWKQTLQEQNQQNKMMLQDPQVPEEQKKWIEQDIKMNEYRIQHNLSPYTEQGIDTVLLTSDSFIMMVTIFTIIVAGGSVAGEFSSGTIKLLLIRPVSRAKILLSKYIATLLYALLLIILLFITTFALGGIFFGFSGLENPILYYADGQVLERSAIEMTWINFGFGAVELIIWVTLAFMISSVFRNSALSIGLSIFILFISMPVMQFLMKYSWAKYLIFANTDLSLYFRGTPLIEGMTLGFSIAVLAVYYLLFQALSFYVFKKRDVGA